MKYRCKICGYIFDEKKEGKKFDELDACPVCGAPKSMFEELKEERKDNRKKDDTERYMNIIQDIAQSGESIIEAMSIKHIRPTWDDIFVLGSQLSSFPLEEDEEINTKTIIGKNSKKPMELDIPVFVSHMSFGALSKEAKIALAIGSKKAKTATCSGEGGILEEEIDHSHKYIFEYVPNLYSVNDENLKRAGAIEIKIGQATKPGMGGMLPGDKVTKEIAEIRDKEPGKSIISPSKFESINSKEDLKNLVDMLREKSEGRPIGIKIAAGKIEDDLEVVIYANPDFVTIDGRGGATGASPKLIRDNTSVPTIYALHRARKYLNEHNSEIELVITGGFRVSSDVAKALAMGADAVAMATAPLIALGCDQYRMCNKGTCPKGIATQDESLRKEIDIYIDSDMVYNYFKVMKEELEIFSRITGNKNIHDLNINDLTTIDSEISNNTDIHHA